MKTNKIKPRKSNKIFSYKNELNNEKSSSLLWYDDKCSGGSGLDQFLKRKAYHSSYLASIEGENRIERRIAEENS